LLSALSLAFLLSINARGAVGAWGENRLEKSETRFRGARSVSQVRSMCENGCQDQQVSGQATAQSGSGTIATPIGETYSVHHQVGGDTLGDGTVRCAFIAADPPTGEPDDTVSFDGNEEALRTDINGTVPLVTETVTDNLDGTQSLIINTRSHSGAALFPAGITDPGSGVAMTDACFLIGLAPPPFGDLLDWPGADTVLDADITYFSNLAPVAGPIDVTSFFLDPWTGFFGVTLTNGSTMDIDAVKLEIRVEKAPQGPLAACCDEGTCIGDVGQETCEFRGGTWVEAGTCADDPSRPSPVCNQTPCNHDNGQPLFDTGAPATQFAPDFPFSSAAADDFILIPSGFEPCQIDGIRAWMTHAPETVNPITDYQGITITVYTDNDSPGPRGTPLIDGSHNAFASNGIVYTQTIPMANVTATAQADACLSGVWQLDIPIEIVLDADTKYWLEVQPILDAAVGRSFWTLSESVNLLPAQEIAPQAGIPSWRDISGNLDACPTGNPPTPDAETRRGLAFRLFGTGVSVPSNDLCSNAIHVEDGIASLNNIGAATDGPSDGAACNDFIPEGTEILSDVWFEYVTSCTGDLTVSTCGSLLGFDTVIGIYDDCDRCPPQTPIVICNDDSLDAACGIRTSEVSLAVEEGTCYQIRVGGVDGSQGTGLLSVSCEIPPPPEGACCNTTLGTCRSLITEAACDGLNEVWTEGVLCSELDPLCVPPPLEHDECVDCIPISTGETFVGTNVSATGEDITNTGVCNVFDTKDVWHCWTADCTGVAVISLCGSDFDTTLAVYDSCGGTELACDDDFCGVGSGSQISPLSQSGELFVEKGQTYYIRVAGWNGTTGTYSLGIRSCANACCNVNGLCRHKEQSVCEAVETDTYHGPNTVCLGDANSNGVDDICEQIPENWLWKDFNGDDPDGYLPDFDQNKDYDNADGDHDPTTGVDSFYGGPTAAADLLVWLDGKYPALGIVPKGDTKIELIESLATLSGTNGTVDHPSPNGRQGPYVGTFIDDLQAGIEAYFVDRGLADVFSVALSSFGPSFTSVNGDLKLDREILLQLGFYSMESVSPIGIDPITSYVVGWRRTGGTNVALAGIDSMALVVAFSDPDADHAESTAVDFVRGGDHDHDGDGNPDTSIPFRDGSYDALRHNDINKASHDVYQALPAMGEGFDESLIPGGEWVVADQGDALAYAASLAPFHEEDAGGVGDPPNSILSVSFLNAHGFPDPEVGQTYTVAEWSITIRPGPTRPCCMPDGSCSLLGPPTCLQEGGTPQDLGTSCSIEFCPVLGDLSGDRDVDREDWVLQNDCLDGPAAPIGTGCEGADLNGDGRIDLGDVRLFWALFTGAL
jgi:hypothetical protein